jgi:hypothetical protein
MRKIWLAIVLCGLIGAPMLYAQITGEIEADIPFNFYVQETRLPAGTYIVRMLGNTDLTVMELRSENDKIAVNFPVEATRAAMTPSHAELVFDRYGNTDFLTKIFEPGNRDGAKVVMTRSELEKQKNGAMPEEHSVPARRR